MLRGPNLPSGEPKERFGGSLGSSSEVVIARGQVFSSSYLCLYLNLKEGFAKNPKNCLFLFVYVLEGW